MLSFQAGIFCGKKCDKVKSQHSLECFQMINARELLNHFRIGNKGQKGKNVTGYALDI